MDNDERIRKWREERGQGGMHAAVAEPLDDLFPDEVTDRVGLPTPGLGGGARPMLPDSIGVQDARLAILERRRAKWRRAAQRVAVFVLAPVFAVLAYIWWAATPLYEGQAVFTVQTGADAPSSGAAGLFGLGGGSNIGDAFKAREFILSRPMMEYMEKRFGLMSQFASSKIDPLTRLNGPTGLNNDPYSYYQRRVRVAVDLQEGVLKLYVQATTPEEATRYGNAILAAAEDHVNRFSDKISHDQIAALTRDVQDAERQVADSRRSLAQVQARRGELSPEQTATAIYQLISSLETQLSEAQRERNGLLSQGLTDSPLLPGLTAKVQDLSAQIEEQRHKLVNNDGSSLQRTAAEFESATSRKDIAQTRWQSTMSTLQQAYLRVLEQRRYFVLIVGMSVGDMPRVRDIFSIAGPVLLFVGLLYLLIFAVRRSTRQIGSFDRRRFAAMTGRWNRR